MASLKYQDHWLHQELEDEYEQEDFTQHPVLCYTILLLIIVKNETHILEI